ncbi:hypothetical protein ABZ819_05260 [Streptomyces venezuelae]|uniref:hypothetical protein n=1 Tax=Streptomyces venezuelae TaxID=54571 RepID=UPI003444096E
MSQTLLDVVHDYERQASRAVRWETREDARRTANYLRRMLGNREAVDPTRFELRLSTLIDLPVTWCERHGYRAVAGLEGYVIQRGDEPTIIAKVGNTLLWDGQRITLGEAT